MPLLKSANVTPVRVAAFANVDARGLVVNVEGAHFILNTFRLGRCCSYRAFPMDARARARVYYVIYC
jgi:hypothetical protein